MAACLGRSPRRVGYSKTRQRQHHAQSSSSRSWHAGGAGARDAGLRQVAPAEGLGRLAQHDHRGGTQQPGTGRSSGRPAEAAAAAGGRGGRRPAAARREWQTQQAAAADARLAGEADATGRWRQRRSRSRRQTQRAARSRKQHAAGGIGRTHQHEAAAPRRPRRRQTQRASSGCDRRAAAQAVAKIENGPGHGKHWAGWVAQSKEPNAHRPPQAPHPSTLPSPPPALCDHLCRRDGGLPPLPPTPHTPGESHPCWDDLARRSAIHSVSPPSSSPAKGVMAPRAARRSAQTDAVAVAATVAAAMAEGTVAAAVSADGRC